MSTKFVHVFVVARIVGRDLERYPLPGVTFLGFGAFRFHDDGKQFGTNLEVVLVVVL